MGQFGQGAQLLAVCDSSNLVVREIQSCEFEAIFKSLDNLDLVVRQVQCDKFREREQVYSSHKCT